MPAPNFFLGRKLRRFVSVDTRVVPKPESVQVVEGDGFISRVKWYFPWFWPSTNLSTKS